MKRLAFLPLLSIVVMGIATADDLTVMNSGTEGCMPLQPDPQACWSEPGDLRTGSFSSMLYDLGAGDTIYSEVANDFIFEESTEIVLVRWWTGVW